MPIVRVPHYNLAIETSGRIGSFTLGRDDEMLITAQLPPQTGGAGSGGSSELMDHLNRQCQAFDITPQEIGEFYLSIGPGSFTGLRIGVTLAKMFAQVMGTKIIAIPTLDVVARNAPAGVDCVAVGLNLKKETLYSGLFQRSGTEWEPIAEPALRTMEQLLAIAPRPLTILGDPLPPLPEGCQDVTILPAELARGRSEEVWRLGRGAAAGGRFDDPLTLLPLYVRPPEAVELWDKRHGKP